MHVQHVVNAVTVDMLAIIECHARADQPGHQACRASVMRFVEKAVDVPDVMQRQVPTIQTLKMTVKDPSGGRCACCAAATGVNG